MSKVMNQFLRRFARPSMHFVFLLTANHHRGPISELRWKQLVWTRGENRTRRSRLVIYNRVDKCGSSTLQALFSRLSLKTGAFKKYASKIYWNRYLNKSSQEELVQFLVKKSNKFPLVFDRHVSYIEFARMNTSRPIYINLVRDPVDRFISLFYFLRSSRRKRNRNYYTEPIWLEKNLTACVLDGDPECDMRTEYRNHRPGGDAEFLQPMTAFFCGHEPTCREFNSRRALQKALYNLEQKYAVVGVLEEFKRSLQVLESFVPQYFRHIVSTYGTQKRKKINQNRGRPETPTAVQEALASRLSADIELYRFAKQRLYLQYKRIGVP